ncbi:DUF3048 domain-containing protein [Candidatus Uhrbacteria bacterium]|nr:DUF3048 domain-containing protein [Candidatus Uhrbacteria bacterium]
MFGRRHQFREKIKFARRPLREGREGARISFPVVVFIASLIISPLIFFTAVAGERFASKMASVFSSLKTKTENGADKPEAPPCLYRHPLDNSCLEERWGNKKIIAVSIDNHIESRPPSGLSSSRLVIEAPVEGGITRFLAFFGEGDEAPEVGPVRSARPYFIDWAEEYQATLAHIGGSPEALERIKKENIKTIDGITFGSPFRRVPSREAPHSTYSSAQKLFEAASRGSEPANPPVLSEAPDSNSGAKRMRIAAASSAYEIEWKYLNDEERYVRFQGGVKTVDKDGSEIAAKNVLALRMPIEVIDDEGRRKIGTIGEGEAAIFTGGKIVFGKWIRKSIGDRTSFVDGGGKEISLAPGTTWIEIISKGAVMEYN